MNRYLQIIVSLFLCSLLVNAQEENQNLTFQGIDADTSKINSPTIGVQVTTDASFFSFPQGESFLIGDYDDNYYSTQVENITDKSSTEYLSELKGWQPALWERVDLFANIALPHQTNIYSLIALRVLTMDSGSPSDFSYTILNLEVEHYFNANYKIRFGRLINKLSASQFYGRMALGSSDTHVFGRSPFVCDAFEFDMNFKDKGLPVFMVGIKPQFNSLDFNTFYAGAHQNISNNWRTYLLFSYNKQHVADIEEYVASIDEDRYYGAFEAELAYNNNAFTSFINLGTYMNYVGVAPHFSGPRDIVKGNEPIITSANLSAKQTFIPSVGFSICPAKLSPKLYFFKKIGIEGEINGLYNDEYTAYNMYANAKVKVFKSINLEYGLNLNKMKYDNNQLFHISDTPVLYTDRFSYGAHYLRMSVMFGKASRKM